MALTDKLSAIGAAIRNKTGGSELLTLDEMPTEIASITTGGGGGDLPEEAFNITGNCSYRFTSNGWNWFIENYGNQITTSNISTANYMFNSSNNLETIPFDININGSSITTESMFSGCSKLKNIGDINFTATSFTNGRYMFQSCTNLREINITGDFFAYLTSSSTYRYSDMFTGCYSLRNCVTALKGFYKKFTVESTTYPNATYSLFKNLYHNCICMDEITDIPVLTNGASSNLFSGAFTNCSRAKNVKFALFNNSSQSSKMYNQIVDLSKYVGYVNHNTTASAYDDRLKVVNYNSGITEDKEVTDAASYEALKNDPDWFTCDINYSRYNHDSAVATIASLPDCSTASGTNTIKFKSGSGALTDGGAISTLTDTEIARATAKGWTVTLVD